MIHELDRLLIAARQHQTCSSEEAKIDGDAIVIPFDAHQRDGTWTIEYERVRNRRELLEALGY
jgi:hypothetical protein